MCSRFRPLRLHREIEAIEIPREKKAKQSVQQQLHCDEPLDFREWAQKRRIDHAAVIMRLIGSENCDLCGTAGQKYERVPSLHAIRLSLIHI